MRDRRHPPIADILGAAQLRGRARYEDLTYPELIGKVAVLALDDAGLGPDDIDGVTLGLAPSLLLGVDEAQYWVATALPSRHLLARVQNAAGSGLAAFRLACAHVGSGRYRHVLVVAGDLGAQVSDHSAAIWQMLDPLLERHVPMNGITLFALQASAYMRRYGATERDLAMVTVKNRGNGAINPMAQLQRAVSLDEVLKSPVVAWPIRALNVGPPGGGAAAVVVAAHVESGRQSRSVAVAGLGACTDAYSIGLRLTPPDPPFISSSALRNAARTAYAMAGIDDPTQSLDVAEIYASYPIVEMTSSEGLGLCAPGTAAVALRDGRFAIDGKLPVNPSGGASCGNPLSATGLIRLVEIVNQLRGEAGAHQVRNARLGVAAAFGGASQLHDVAVLSR